MVILAMFLLVFYAWIWIWFRPTRFEVTPDAGPSSGRAARGGSKGLILQALRSSHGPNCGSGSAGEFVSDRAGCSVATAGSTPAVDGSGCTFHVSTEWSGSRPHKACRGSSHPTSRRNLCGQCPVFIRSDRISHRTAAPRHSTQKSPEYARPLPPRIRVHRGS